MYDSVFFYMLFQIVCVVVVNVSLNLLCCDSVTLLFVSSLESCVVL